MVFQAVIRLKTALFVNVNRSGVLRSGPEPDPLQPKLPFFTIRKSPNGFCPVAPALHAGGHSDLKLACSPADVHQFNIADKAAAFSAEKNAPYFCGVNFARHIDVPIGFVVGFIDTVCPPHTGYAAYNVCPSKTKAIFYSVGWGHDASRGEGGKALNNWMSKIRQR